MNRVETVLTRVPPSDGIIGRKPQAASRKPQAASRLVGHRSSRSSAWPKLLAVLAALLLSAPAVFAETVTLLDSIGDGDWGDGRPIFSQSTSEREIRQCFSTPSGSDPYLVSSITLLLGEADLTEPLTTPDGIKLALKADSDLPLVDPTTEFVLESTKVRQYYNDTPPYVEHFYARYVPRVPEVLRGGQDYCLTLWAADPAWYLATAYADRVGWRRDLGVESDVGYTSPNEYDRYLFAGQRQETVIRSRFGMTIMGRPVPLQDPVRTSHVRDDNVVRITHEFDYPGPDPDHWILFRCQTHSRAGKAYRDPNVCRDPDPDAGYTYPGDSRSITIEEYPPSGVHGHRIQSPDGLVLFPTVYYDVGLGRNVADGGLEILGPVYVPNCQVPGCEGALQRLLQNPSWASTFGANLQKIPYQPGHDGRPTYVYVSFAEPLAWNVRPRDVERLMEMSCGRVLEAIRMPRIPGAQTDTYMVRIDPCNEDLWIGMRHSHEVRDKQGRVFGGAPEILIEYDP